jgi:HEPN domain-containing protein
MANERATFQQLAQLRLSEAKTLLKNGQPSGAYYLAGYCVECSLKAIIAKQFRGDEIPDKNLVNKIYTHDLSDLLRLAGLESELDAERRANSELDRRWSIVKNWTEQARYSVWTKEQATAIIDAVAGDGRNGGFSQWLTPVGRAEVGSFSRVDQPINGRSSTITCGILGITLRKGKVGFLPSP